MVSYKALNTPTKGSWVDFNMIGLNRDNTHIFTPAKCFGSNNCYILWYPNFIQKFTSSKCITIYVFDFLR